MMRIMIKVLLFPLIILLGLFECVCSVAVGLSGMVFRLIAGVFILTAFLGYGFGLEPWPIAMRMILGGVIFLVIPMIGAIMVSGITVIKSFIRMI